MEKKLLIKEKSFIETEITAVTNEGSGISRYEGMVVFTPFTAPGDKAKVKIAKVGKNCIYGELDSVLVPSAERTEPDCDVFGECGGCSLRHIKYEAELREKTNWVRDHVQRIGGFDIEPLPAIGSPKTEEYRNKAIYQVGKGAKGEPVFGFYRKKSHEVMDCRNCRLQPKEFSDILEAVGFFVKQNRISIYDERSHSGLLRAVYIRKAEATGEIGICLVLNGEKLPGEKLLVSLLSTQFENIVSIMLNTNKERTNVVLGKKSRTIFGKDGITDVLCGVTVDISPAAFYQVNRSGAEILYKTAAEFENLSCGELLLDLYCGAGTIGLSMAKKAGKLIGVEIVPEAIENAKINAERMGVKNAEFICGDAGSAASELEKRGTAPDVIILDPPRKGCSEDTLEAVAKMAPKRVVYVSCNTATMARDFKIMQSFGYEPVKVQPVDMFPKTAHVEGVGLMIKNFD
ncbi:MAG: 23S rRNA (uracil(1939)-C(5))-methyltransferase RlmD [Oscillospiraceae bacterium]|nr:23S rRNA (uracil(1939)-C(5))-methyltransferase RlmD [Oscillospiraceae bacterium]